MSLIVCDRCQGKGKFIGLGLIESNCSKCDGKRFIDANQKTTVNIEQNDRSDKIAQSKTENSATNIELKADQIIAQMNKPRGRPKKSNAAN